MRHKEPEISVEDVSELPNRQTAIFWDIENCAPPKSMPGHVVVKEIRRVIHHFGNITMFKAYLEISDNNSKRLRSELQSSGVSLTDCPHNGRKDSTDKMILVDMLAFAIDNPPPATVVLISGDRDFVYALSILRNRRFTIVLIVPNMGAPVILQSQANSVLEWKYDVLRFDAWQKDVTGSPSNTLISFSERISTPVDQEFVNELPHAEISSVLTVEELEIHCVKILQEFQMSGNDKPRRSVVGLELIKRNPLLYHRAGVSNFKDYIELAQKEGIVIVGGKVGFTG